MPLHPEPYTGKGFLESGERDPNAPLFLGGLLQDLIDKFGTHPKFQQILKTFFSPLAQHQIYGGTAALNSVLNPIVGEAVNIGSTLPGIGSATSLLALEGEGPTYAAAKEEGFPGQRPGHAPSGSALGQNQFADLMNKIFPGFSQTEPTINSLSASVAPRPPAEMLQTAPPRPTEPSRQTAPPRAEEYYSKKVRDAARPKSKTFRGRRQKRIAL